MRSALVPSQVGPLSHQVIVRLLLHDASVKDLDVKGVLGFAQHALLNAHPLRAEMDHNQKQRFQGVLFLDGVRFDERSFGTSTTSSVFNYLNEIVEDTEEVMTHPTPRCSSVPLLLFPSAPLPFLRDRA